MPLPALGAAATGARFGAPFLFFHGPHPGAAVNNLQQATEKICELKGGLLALDAVVTTLITALPEAQRATMSEAFARHSEMARPSSTPKADFERFPHPDANVINKLALQRKFFCSGT